MENAVEFVIPGIPTAWARAGARGRIHFTPGKQRRAMSVVAMVSSDAMGDRPPFTGPVSVTVTASWAWPKSIRPRKRQALGSNYRASRPDADNVAKLIADSLTGIVYVDDAQICELRVRKIYSMSSFTKVQIAPLSEESVS